MTSPDSSPKLPFWIFLVSYAVLVAAAIFIGFQAGRPLSTAAVVSIVACIMTAVVVLLVPIVARYEQQKNQSLDERQRALESLATTVSASAEQIGIAASGLHQVSEAVHKTLKQADHLPHKLQDKIAEFQAQLSAANDAEKEELERELVSLRSSESERLEGLATKIAKSTAEFAKLETAAQQHLAAANEALAKVSMGTAAAIGKAQAAAEQALAQARIEASKHVGEAAGHATRALEDTKTAALAEFEARLAAAVTRIIEQLGRDVAPKAVIAEPSPSTTEIASTGVIPSEAVAAPAQPPKRPRKSRPIDQDDASAASTPLPATTTETSAPEPTATATAEPAPIPAEKIPEVSPVVPHTAQPFAAAPANIPGATETHAPTEAAPAASPEPESPAPVTEPPKIARRRVARKTEAEEAESEPKLALELDESSSPNGAHEKTLTSDGATRLLVTAYIGIGNRLFIRGAGPGLTWEKGIPLQFVSIGKWRWETSDASAPVQFKLYKNDDVECTALGEQTVEPGYQQEVTAAF